MRDFPHLGHGVGLRPPHYPLVLDGTAKADWFEVISENFLIPGGRPLRVLEKARALAPVVFHGVSMNLGGADPLDPRHLADLADLARRFEPAWISEHVCWGAARGHYAHDLLPLPFTDEALRHTARRIRHVQDALGRRILVENVSSYVTFKHSAMTEWEFLSALASEADCGLLLDVNNVVVSAFNHGFSASECLAGLPRHRIGQIHLAGHSDAGTHLLDTHDHDVPEVVWNLYREALGRFGPVTTLVERDDRIPPFDRLLAEARRARDIEQEVLSAHAHSA